MNRVREEGGREAKWYKNKNLPNTLAKALIEADHNRCLKKSVVMDIGMMIVK